MKKERIWVNKANSFKEAAKFDTAYYMKMSGAERISTVQFLREIYGKFNKKGNENRKRFRKVIKIIQ